jgi:hypothetical protein
LFDEYFIEKGNVLGRIRGKCRIEGCNRMQATHGLRNGKRYYRTKCEHHLGGAHSKVGQILRKYKLTKQQYESLVAEQGGVCAICGDGVKLSVDHNHTTNKVRGLLCTSCNIGLGLFKDNVKRLYGAIEYIYRNN